MGKDAFDVNGMVVVVTGGLGKLGRQFSIDLCNRGAKIAVLDIRAEADLVRERFGDLASNEELCLINADVARRSSIEAALEEISRKWGVPHALINNAGLDAPPNSVEGNESFEDYSESAWDRVMEVNTKGVFLCSQVLGGAMAREGRGAIINISSIYGIVSPDQRVYSHQSRDGVPFIKPVAYSASKAAIVNLTRYLATYWAPRNVRVNTLTLGGVYDNQNPQFISEYCERVPLRRMAMPGEYNAAIVFLISDASSYMTGANMIIDGGWTAW